MKRRRLLALLFGSCFFFAVTPNVAWSQPGGQPTGGGPTTGANPANSTPVSTTTVPIKSATSGAGSLTSVPSSNNPYVQNFGDPLSMGKPTNYATSFGPLAKPVVTFGKGIYSTTAGAVSTSASTITNPANGFTEYGVFRNPPYSTVLSSDLPMVSHSASALQADARSVIDRSSFLRNPRAIQVSASDGVVQLSGQVASEKERRIVEGMVRMTPGVRNVQNELKVVPTN
jgi:BON domain